MAFEQQQREALQLLQSIENGTTSSSTIAHQIEEADPALVHFVLTWLRSHYGGDHPAAEGVIGRMVELTSKYPSVKKKMTEGKSDAVVSWFEENNSYRDLPAPQFIAVIVEKLEG